MFSSKLKNLRNITGMTQKDLSSILNVSISTIAMWETGKREPDFNTLKLIASFFDVTSDYLLDIPDPIKPSFEPTIESLLAYKGITNQDDVSSVKRIIDLMEKNKNNGGLADELIKREPAAN